MLCRVTSRSFHMKNDVQFLFRRFSSSRSVESVNEMGKKCLVFSEEEGYVMKSPYGSISIPEMTLDQYVWKDLSKWQNHIAIECGVTGHKYTYAKLRDHCAAFAIRLRSNLKLKKSDVISICLPNVPDYAVAFLGSIESGLIVTTINPAYTSEEISRQFSSCQPKAVVFLAENYDVLKRACSLAQQPDIKLIVIQSDANSHSDTISFKELINTAGLRLSDSLNFNNDTSQMDVSTLLYSSGTTGMPKGVMLTHHNLVSNCQSINAPLPDVPLVLPTTNNYQDIFPCFLPFYHVYGLMVILVPKLVKGAKIVSMPKYNVETFLRITKEHKATGLHLVPPVVVQLNNYPGCTAENFEYLRYMMCAASRLPQSDGERFQKIAKNATLFQGYGLTETSPMCSLTPQGLQNCATIGWPVPNMEMKITNIDDPNFKGLPPNETGELLARGSQIMKGYYKNEEATNSMITEGKWLRTGDIGHVDENGFFYISDRLKELIKVNANQVAPAELEGILREHPDVVDAVVVGIPHPQFGEVPKAFVIRKAGSKVSETDIQQFVAKQVIKFKQLTGGVQFVDNIPKTATGKYLRREIRDAYA